MQIETKWCIFLSVQWLRQIATLKRKLRRETGLLNTSLVGEASAVVPPLPLHLRWEGQDVAVQGRGRRRLRLGYPTLDVGIFDILVLKGRKRKNRVGEDIF